MTARATAAVLLAGFGAALAVAVTAYADEPITPGQPATVYVTVSQTVPARAGGLTAAQQARRARGWRRAYAQADRDRDKRGRTIRRLKTAARARASSSIFGTIQALLCVHGGEGSWGASTGNGYHGGLQMDWPFMHAYGSWALARWGTADRWPPEVQLVVGLTAIYSGRGFYPWPNTARACGLL